MQHVSAEIEPSPAIQNASKRVYECIITLESALCVCVSVCLDGRYSGIRYNFRSLLLCVCEYNL